MVIAAMGALAPTAIAHAAPADATSGATATATAAAAAAVERSATRWQAAADRFAETAAVLGNWVHAVDADDVGARMGAFVNVQLREALAAGQRWLATTIDGFDALPTPDLSALCAAPVKGVESSGFGWRDDPINHRPKFHKGTDFKADRGTPVYAAGDGVVIIAGQQHGYGNVVYVDHGAGIITRYGHLSRVGVKKGQVVKADELIGKVGATGRATGPHLHFEVRIDGRAVDPGLAMDVAALQRSQPAVVSRLAAMSLLPSVQDARVDRHGPPRHKHRPERRGRSRRDRPNT